jgi:exosortase D (VPLPA-CTERM-specific)
MVSSVETRPSLRQETTLALWLWIAAGLLLCALVARDGLALMTGDWLGRPEYSHGILIPFIAAFLVWQRRATTGIQDVTGGWAGPGVVALGLLLWMLGRLSTIYAVSQYALAVMLYGVVISIVGARVFSRLWAPMVMLLLAIPLPAFFYNNLSSQLQLVSSALGVWFIRLFGISVYLSGNVIDLGHFQMQVVEACDGLRYLFPLMTLGFIVAYFFRAPLWQRLAVFLSSVPLTIVMNSIRIGMIGILADRGNTALAEGLLHELQGWVIFMASGALLLAETWVLVKLFMPGGRWRGVLALDLPPSRASAGPGRTVKVPLSLVAATVLLAAAAGASYAVPERVETHPARSWFLDFPTQIGEWKGRQGRIEDMYLDVLKLDDYVLSDYTNGQDVVNFYVAYYASQRQGESVHSPRSCIPGGGWRITSFEQRAFTGAPGAPEVHVNRAMIQLGDQRQLVYYWFKQRDRVITSEYLVKWYIFVDALTRGRTDGALVRLITPVAAGEDERAADERLQTFARETQPVLTPFLPD